MLTTLCVAEGVINSRTLTYVYNGTEDPEPICPAQLLTGRRNSRLPSLMAALGTISFSAEDTQTLWNHRLNVENRFWQAWQTEYLAQLRKPLKGNNTVKKIQPNVVVIVCQANSPRAFWKLGRITEVFQSKDDGVCRAANVKTYKGILKRSAAHLYHLEQSDHDLDAGEKEFDEERELGSCESTDPSSIEPIDERPRTSTRLDQL